MAEPVVPSFQNALRLGVLAAVVLFLGALVLWSRYGGSVFLEMVATAWAYCF